MSQSEFSSDFGEGGDFPQTELDEEKRRKRLLLLLTFLLLLLGSSSALFIRYLREPAPLPDMLPVPVGVNYPPHYLFSIYGMDQPVGVTLSPDGGRIYVTETGGERLVRMFDTEGGPLGSFAPPATRSAERSPVYLAAASDGRVFVTDRIQHAIFVYDQDGQYLDTILGPDLTLNEYIGKHMGGMKPGTTFSYSVFNAEVLYQPPGEAEQSLPAPDLPTWSPLGVRFDGQGRMWLTDVTENQNTVREISSEWIFASDWNEFDPEEQHFGETGQENDQFLFPNAAVVDSQGRIYVSDGNNGRISVWDEQHNFLFHFGRGSGDGSLSLPRGIFIDARDRLFVVDAVGQDVKVYDVSGSEPAFLYAFGDFGMDNGLFNYPNDIYVDGSGRLYIADRENNRIQVWSY